MLLEALFRSSIVRPLLFLYIDGKQDYLLDFRHENGACCLKNEFDGRSVINRLVTVWRVTIVGTLDVHSIGDQAVPKRVSCDLVRPLNPVPNFSLSMFVDGRGDILHPPQTQ